MAKQLAGKIALVTGGSRGIGAAIVKRLAREGAHVALTYVSNPDQANETVKAAQALGVKALAIQADSADAEAVVAAVERTVRELGGIDILVNNAGIAIMAPIDDYRLEDFDRTVAVNVRAVFVATQAAVKHMKAGGRIINIGSCNAERMPFAGRRRLRHEQGRAGGAGQRAGARPRPARHHHQQRPARAGGHRHEPGHERFRQDADSKLMAVPRYGTGDEIASLVAYLAGPEAGFVTGASLTIDGGFTA